MEKINNTMNFKNEIQRQFDFLEYEYSLIEKYKEEQKESDLKIKEFYNNIDFKDMVSNNEIKEKIEKLKEEEDNYKNVIDLHEFTSLAIKDNIANIMYYYFKNVVVDLLRKFENKNIGQKTKEKINDIIKESIKSGLYESDKVYAYIYREYSNWTISIEVNGVNIKIYKYDNDKDLCTYGTLTDNILEYEDIKNIYNDRLKALEKLKELSSEIEKIREETNKNLHNNLHCYYIEKNKYY